MGYCIKIEFGDTLAYRFPMGWRHYTVEPGRDDAGRVVLRELKPTEGVPVQLWHISPEFFNREFNAGKFQIIPV